MRLGSAARRGLVLVLLALFALPPSLSDAARWDPRFRWHTLDTEHFSIHFHQGLTGHAAEMALVAEEVHALLVPFAGWRPRGRTQVVLVDPTDSANGYAQTVPGNSVTLFVVQPTPETSLDNHENWLWAIFVHEYAHILQIDTTSGIPQVVRWVLGRLIMPNSVLPRWITEGYATWIETRFTTGGRGRSTYTDALMRMAAVDGGLPPIDIAEGDGQRWPRGQMRYLYGVDFHFAVEDDHGPESWVRFHQLHGRWVIPWLLPAREAFGETFVKQWKRWREHASRDQLAAIEAIEAAGVTPTRTLPTRAGQASRPRYSPDGAELWYVHSSPKERASLRAVARDGSGDRLIRGGGGGGLVFGPGGQTAYFSAGGTTSRYESFLDLYGFDLESRRARRLTRGGRLRDPAPHPDGSLVAVQSSRGATQLVRVELPDEEDPDDGEQRKASKAGKAGKARKARKARKLYRERGAAWCPEGPGGTAFDPERPCADRAEEAGEYFVGRGESAVITQITAAADGSQFAHPAWDPTGDRLAVSVWKPGGFRDIHVLDRDGRLLRSVTWDRAGDTYPAWTPDGRHLLFASDRDGVWNIYAHRWSDGSLHRVTRVLGGAYAPDVHPAGDRLAIQAYTSDGWRVEELPLDEASWEPLPFDPRSAPAPDGGPSAMQLAPRHPLEGVPGPDRPWGTGPRAAVERARARPDFRTPAPPGEPFTTAPGPREDVSALREAGSVAVYNPLLTLFPPRYLSVFGGLTDTGAMGGVGTGGVDVLGQHSWGASLSFQTDSRYLGWSLGYTLNAFHPILSASFRTLSVDYGPLWLRHSGGFAGAYRSQERYYERRDALLVGATVPIARRHSLSARYSLEFRNPLRPLPDNVDPDRLAVRGSFSGIVLGWAYGDFQRYAASISPENSQLVSLSADIESSFLGAFRVEPDGSRSSLHRVILTLEGRRYFTLPWARNHVLAVRGVAGATIGTDIPQPTFRIGGPFGDNPYVSLPDRYYALRGYGTSSMRGDHLYLGSVEYRLPLVYIERGFWTAPIWLRSVGLTVYAEAGQVFDTATYAAYQGSPAGFAAFWAATRPSVGVELVGDVSLGWAGLFQGRVGYGLGLGPNALAGGAFYAQLGTSF